MRVRQWLIFATLVGSVLCLVSVATVPSAAQGQEQGQGQVREFSITGNHYAFSPAAIQVNKNDVVKITFTATDIPHSFTLDDYRILKRASAGQTVTFEFRADRTGSFTFYCGLSVDAKCKDMKGLLTVR